MRNEDKVKCSKHVLKQKQKMNMGVLKIFSMEIKNTYLKAGIF